MLMTRLRQQLVERLAAMGIEQQMSAGRNDQFAALCYRGKAFAHFHDDNELDLHLTRSVIEREGLVHPPHSRVHPGRSKKSHWIELSLNTVADLEQATRLIRLAIAQIKS